MIITTSVHPSPSLIEKARSLSAKYGIEYYPRKKRSVEYFHQHVSNEVFVVNNMRGVSFYKEGNCECFFHPNMAYQRIIRLNNGLHDSLAEACQLKPGMSFFDGTLGLASDSIVASYIFGDGGFVLGVEKSFPLYVLLEEGFQFYATQHPEMAPLLQRITIKNDDNINTLRECSPSSFDVVYFDFMFTSPVTGSFGIQALRDLACYDTLTKEHINEAIRVAKKRVVIKANGDFNDELTDFGFRLYEKRRFYYAILEK